MNTKVNFWFLFFLVFPLVLAFQLSAQTILPTIEWVLRDGLTACEFQSVAKTDDGGLILGGRIYDISDPLQRGNECVLAKVNAQGVLQCP